MRTIEAKNYGILPGCEVSVKLNALLKDLKGDKDREQRLSLLRDNIAATEERDDLYVEYLNLLADGGEYAKAMSLVGKRRFHPWEGGEGKVTRLYKRLKCVLAVECAEKGYFAQAEKLYKDCLSFPDNLGEGKLILDFDNNVWYMLGELYASAGDNEKAKRAYTLALRGDLKVADNMYYNDTPAEYVYFAAKAKIKLGDKTGASETARAFAEYARQNKGRHVKIDYFAVSLPDLLVWEQDLDERNDEFCDRMQGYVEEIYKEVKQ